MTWHLMKLTRYIQHYKSQNALYAVIEKLLIKISVF